MTDYFDTIVIGAGVMGSAAAYHWPKTADAPAHRAL
jgi:FAD dependent oxidoreductase.